MTLTWTLDRSGSDWLLLFLLPFFFNPIWMIYYAVLLLCSPTLFSYFASCALGSVLPDFLTTFNASQPDSGFYSGLFSLLTCCLVAVFGWMILSSASLLALMSVYILYVLWGNTEYWLIAHSWNIPMRQLGPKQKLIGVPFIWTPILISTPFIWLADAVEFCTFPENQLE